MDKVMLKVKNTSSRKAGMGRIIIPNKPISISGIPILPRVRVLTLLRTNALSMLDTSPLCRAFRNCQGRKSDAARQSGRVIARTVPGLTIFDIYGTTSA